MKSEAAQVLVVGAGPTGLSLTSLLAKLGVSSMLIDQKEGPSRESKAFGIQARTLEIFEQLGIAEQAIREGSVDTTVHIFKKDKEYASIRVHELLPGESPYPYFLILPQHKTEQLLISSLEQEGQQVHWQHKLTEAKEENGGISVLIEGPDGEKKRRVFQYLVGCDGAGSRVREQFGFAFGGKTYSPTFYLADGKLDWEYPHGDVYFTLAPQYLSIIFSFPEKNNYRLFNFLNKDLNKREGELSVADIQKILDANPYLDQQLTDCSWSSVFSIHSRITNNFRKGRVFLAGDAAHVHSPVGGQGMNTGIQDVYNLAWKLGLMVKGLAAPSLLASYHEERHIIAKNLHKTTDRYFQLMIAQSKAADFFRLHLFPRMFRFITQTSWLRKQLFWRVSQLAIKYRYSSISREGAGKGFARNAPRAGDRAPYTTIQLKGKQQELFQLFSYSRFTLLITVANPREDRITEMAQDLEHRALLPLAVHVLAASENKSFLKKYGIRQEGMFLLRPDGHIGYRTTRLNAAEIHQYLSRISGK